MWQDGARWLEGEEEEKDEEEALRDDWKNPGRHPQHAQYKNLMEAPADAAPSQGCSSSPLGLLEAGVVQG